MSFLKGKVQQLELEVLGGIPEDSLLREVEVHELISIVEANSAVLHIKASQVLFELLVFNLEN